MRFTTLLVFYSLLGCGITPLLATDPAASKSKRPAHNDGSVLTPIEVVSVRSAPPLPPAPPEASGTGIATTRYVRPAVASSIAVEASSAPIDPTSVQITPQMIETAAGAFEDPARYVQMLSGVVSGSDARNGFLVRGGNPSENLFVIDNIDVHSISHLALAGTSGGFVSMIDNAAIQSMTLHTAGHDAKFNDRLSSVVEISTIPDQQPGRRATVRHMTEAGIAGVGGMDSRPFGDRGSLFVSGREGILHFFTNDIGLNGVPRYTNNLVRGDSVFANGDKLWGMALTGIDSIRIHPNAAELEETNPFDVKYSGWRNTTGLNWQHGFSGRFFGVFTLSNSEQAQTVGMNAQQAGGLSIYNEQTHEGNTTLKTQLTMQANERLTLSGGATTTLTRLFYNIDQAKDAATNPYDATGASTTGMNVHRNLATMEKAGYGQATLTLPANLRLTVAARAQQWAFGSNFVVTPKASLSVPLGRSHIFSLGIADYAQMPSFLYLLSFPQNQALQPIRARHLTAALTLVDSSHLHLALAAYRKTYRDYPVSAQLPQLSLANVGDTFGQAFLMFPMLSRGLGRAAGAELSMDLKPMSRLMVTANLAYSRTRFSGLDGVFRNSIADLPLVANLAAVGRLGHGLTASIRYSAASGRPYTPDNMTLSTQQNRDVYDLTRINALRAPAYGRLDFRFERVTRFRGGELQWHLGLDNALNRKNFYSYQWQPNTGTVAKQYQMPLFPDGGVKYTF